MDLNFCSFILLHNYIPNRLLNIFSKHVASNDEWQKFVSCSWPSNCKVRGIMRRENINVSAPGTHRLRPPRIDLFPLFRNSLLRHWASIFSSFFLRFTDCTTVQTNNTQSFVYSLHRQTWKTFCSRGNYFGVERRRKINQKEYLKIIRATRKIIFVSDSPDV